MDENENNEEDVNETPSPSPGGFDPSAFIRAILGLGPDDRSFMVPVGGSDGSYADKRAAMIEGMRIRFYDMLEDLSDESLFTFMLVISDVADCDDPSEALRSAAFYKGNLAREMHGRDMCADCGRRHLSHKAPDDISYLERDC